MLFLANAASQPESPRNSVELGQLLFWSDIVGAHVHVRFSELWVMQSILDMHSGNSIHDFPDRSSAMRRTFWASPVAKHS